MKNTCDYRIEEMMYAKNGKRKGKREILNRKERKEQEEERKEK